MSRLLADEDIDGLSDRRLTGGETRTSWSVTLQGFYDMQSFVVDTHAGTPVTVTVVGDPDGFVEAVASDGSVMEFSDSNETGAERLTFAGDGRVPTIVTLGQFSVGQGEFNVSFTHPAARYDDPDDGRELVAGRPLAGHIDHASDVDYYVFDLAAGQSVRITVDSIAFDPVLFVDSPTNEGPILAMDDDSAGGLLGLSSAVTFIAPSSGCYLLGTADFFRELTGGYVVEMAAAAPLTSAGTGTIVSGTVPSDGFGLFVFGGGTSAQLVAAAGCSSGRAMFFVLIDGQWVSFIPAAPPSVNTRWNAVFPASIAPSTPMLGSCNESRGTEQ